MRSKIALIFFYFSYLFFPHFTEQVNKQMIAIIVDRELIINSSSGVKFYIPFGGVPSSGLCSIPPPPPPTDLAWGQAQKFRFV